MSGTRYVLEINPVIPKRLARLQEIANDLLYSWDREVRSLFFRLDPELWESSGHNPKVFLRRIAQKRLEEALEDRVFMEDYNRVLSSYDTYHQESARPAVTAHLDPKTDLVAYFCAEFGLHESVQIYPAARHPGRRPLQGGQRPQSALCRRRPALPAGLFHSDHRCPRPADRPLLADAL